MRSPRALSTSASFARALVCVCALQACNLNNPGQSPPAADIYMPTGLALSAQSRDSAPRYLYVVNSNFDLRYNRGSVQAYDLDAIDNALGACARPGPDCTVDPQSVLVDEVLVPSLATGLAFTDDHSRLYVVTRAVSSMTFIDIDEQTNDPQKVLQCDATDRRCSDARQRGADPRQSPRGFAFPPEPVGVVSMPAASVVANGDASATPGNFVMVAHRNGQASLFYDDGSSGPVLLDVLSNLPFEPTAITFDPTTQLTYLTVYARNGIPGLPKLLLRVGVTAQQPLNTSFAFDAGGLIIDGVTAQRDTRAIAMNPLRAGEALVVSQQPNALLFVDVGPNAGGALPATDADTRDEVDVSGGAQRIAVGALGPLNIAAISCFDSRELFLIDLSTSAVLTIVHNFNGPFEAAIDDVRQRLYLGDFRSSVVRIIDLSQITKLGSSASSEAPVIGTLGVPKVLEELQ